MKPIFGFKNKSDFSVMFDYSTNQGNRKKAFFTRIKDAEMVWRRYISDKEEWAIVVIAETND